jgi:hypothetical protein
MPEKFDEIMVKVVEFLKLKIKTELPFTRQRVHAEAFRPMRVRIIDKRNTIEVKRGDGSLALSKQVVDWVSVSGRLGKMGKIEVDMYRSPEGWVVITEVWGKIKFNFDRGKQKIELHATG